MSMTKKEQLLKAWLIRKLKSQGYLTYAKILREFEVHLLHPNSNHIAYLEIDKGVFAMNSAINDEQASVIIRHEILHAFLQHQLRAINKLAREKNLDPDQLTETQIKDLKTDVYSDVIRMGAVFGNNDPRQVHINNIAGDYEISNRGYTEKDKETVRNLQINGQVVGGLVTEDKHPEWAEMSLEELYDEIRKLRDNDDYVDDSSVLGALISPKLFVDINGNFHGVVMP